MPEATQRESLKGNAKGIVNMANRGHCDVDSQMRGDKMW